MAPSGSNMQPWHIHAVTGQPLEQLIKKALAYATENPVGNVRQEYQASRKTSSTHTNQGVLPVAWLYIQRLVSTVRTE